MDRDSGRRESFRLLLGEKTLRSGVKRIARKISSDYRGTAPVFVGILNGSFVFLADLVRDVSLECEIDFVTISSYRRNPGVRSRLIMRSGPALRLTGRDVIVVEDVVDSGTSLKFLKTFLRRRRPRTLRVAALLVKKRAEALSRPDYVGFVIPNDFVAGYGMDLRNRMRNRRSVYRLLKGKE